MSELVCKCGHRVKNHSIFGCVECGCMLTAIPATHAAQRAAAIAHLREMAKELKLYLPHFPTWCYIVDDIVVAIKAYRAIGVLKAPKP